MAEVSELKQSKFQKICSKISKVSFWLWLGTITAFVVIVAWMQKPENMKATPDWLVLGDIGLGVLAFIVAILARFIAQARTKEENKSILKTLGLGVGGLILLVLLGNLPSSSSGSINGARLFASPLPITTTATKTPTPAPKTNTTTQAIKPKAQQIDCVGPDSKTFKTTAEECTKFRTDWGLPASPTPWPTPQARTTTTSTQTQGQYICKIYDNGYVFSTKTEAECIKYQVDDMNWNLKMSNCKTQSDAQLKSCLDPCNQTNSENKALCAWAYASNENGYDSEKYGQCLDESLDEWSACTQPCYDNSSSYYATCIK